MSSSMGFAAGHDQAARKKLKGRLDELGLILVGLVGVGPTRHADEQKLKLIHGHRMGWRVVLRPVSLPQPAKIMHDGSASIL
jgi:hypothetical protein